MSEIYALAEVTAKDGKLEQFKKAMNDLKEGSLLEAGVIDYQILQHKREKNKFFVIERYKDKAAVELHKKAAHTLAYFEVKPEVVESAVLHVVVPC